jgi:hypothetical protein
LLTNKTLYSLKLYLILNLFINLIVLFKSINIHFKKNKLSNKINNMPIIIKLLILPIKAKLNFKFIKIYIIIISIIYNNINYVVLNFKFLNYFNNFIYKVHTTIITLNL